MPWPTTNKAECLLKMGQASAGVDLFDQALRIRPSLLQGPERKGDALVRAGGG